jgi:Putative MetA-pathway of phenol degradation
VKRPCWFVTTAAVTLVVLAGAAHANGEKSLEPLRQTPRGSSERLAQAAQGPPSEEERAPPERETTDAAREEADSEDDEALALRALERSLTQRGALLLPVWGFEIVPQLSYSRSENFALRLPPPGEIPQQSPGQDPVRTRTVRVRTHQLEGLLTLRLGLPWELQIEGSMPWLRIWRDESDGVARATATASGLGDPQFSVTRHLVHARGAVPDVLIAGSWRPPVGTSPFDVQAEEVGFGSGSHGVGVKLTASKVADPLVYLANASYVANLRDDAKQGEIEIDIDPGDEWGFSGGAILAVSPGTSMSFLLDFQYTPEVRVGGKLAPGTDEVAAVLQLGVATLASRRALLNFVLGIGLTEDSPDFQFGVSVPLH